MSAPSATPGPSENWDEDFEPEQNHESHSDGLVETRHTTTTPLARDKKNTLRRCTDAGPSTPSKRPTYHTENWDDDFQDGTDSPMSRPSRARGGSPQTENWDEDFEDNARTSPRRKIPRRRESWGSSDEDDGFGFADKEEDRTVTSRSRGMPFSLPSDFPPPPLPPLPSPFPRSPTASVFSVPVSSTGGRDSVAGHSYSSTAHLALRPTLSSGSSTARLALLPPSPPIHRERRRLRKKSRPPLPLEDNIYELDDRAEVPHRPPTPEQQNSSPPPAPSDDHSTGPIPASAPTFTKTPLLSRIGSVGKKWGAGRRKRASTGPSEVALYETKQESEHEQDHTHASFPVPIPSTPPSSSKNGWFFQGGGGGPGPGFATQHPSALRHEKSVDKFLFMMGVNLAHLRAEAGTDIMQEKARAEPQTGFFEICRCFNGRSRTTCTCAAICWILRPPAPRHASHGQGTSGGSRTSSSRSSSRQRSASASVEDVSRMSKTREGRSKDVRRAADAVKEQEHEKEKEHGNRSFMGGVRRISLVGSAKHKRTESSAPNESQHSYTVTSCEVRKTFSFPQSSYNPHRHHIPMRDDPFRPAQSTHTKSNSDERQLESSRSHPTLSSRSSAGPSSTTVTMGSSSSAPIASPSPSPIRTKISTSPQQVASLGRSTQLPKERESENVASVPRRNSLGDLKIPPRISQAQVGLRRDLGMVREFATSVEQLKQLQGTYCALIGQVQTLISSTQPPSSRAISPPLFHLPKPRSRSNTSPGPPAQSSGQLMLALLNIESKYRISWECAELLIDIGGGGPAATTSASPPSSSQSAPVVPTTVEGRKSRERAVTLAGDESKPIVNPPPSALGSPSPTSPPISSQWRASTGRHDLSQRQLHLLREMLNNSDSSATMNLDAHIPEEDSINRDWRWGDAMNSTITLPSEESTQTSASATSGTRSGIAAGLSSSPAPPSATSLSAAGTKSSCNLPHPLRPQSLIQRRRAKTSSGPELMASRSQKHPNSPYGTTPSLPHKSPRRIPADGTLTVKGRKGRSPYILQQTNWQDSAGHRELSNASHSSIWTESSPQSAHPQSPSSYSRSTKLSDVQERPTRPPSRGKQSAPSPSRRQPSSRNRSHQSGSVRSAPPQTSAYHSSALDTTTLPDMKLAMSPENIRPLLENAREVYARCSECIVELEALVTDRINRNVQLSTAYTRLKFRTLFVSNPSVRVNYSSVFS
ncbi:hypothetical protein A0H81_06595 [Grifola frondosa]|uniref:Uncharacterized protein n=1 Tax=Grifola frondosa TaxID=5627 RepID=A0A1C7M843_GRIFR|nr:hypothetical protein A0H81_06595 [Grifola frondosa]